MRAITPKFGAINIRNAEYDGAMNRAVLTIQLTDEDKRLAPRIGRTKATLGDHFQLAVRNGVIEGRDVHVMAGVETPMEKWSPLTRTAVLPLLVQMAVEKPNPLRKQQFSLFNYLRAIGYLGKAVRSSITNSFLAKQPTEFAEQLRAYKRVTAGSKQSV